MNHTHLTGRRYGKLVVTRIEFLRRTPSGQYKYRVHCQCDCGQPFDLAMERLNLLQRQMCRTCREGEDGAIASHPLGHTWHGMHDRCYNPKNTGYKHYGGRGIGIHPLWRKVEGDMAVTRAAFKAFCDHVGEKPPGTSIDRIDNDGDYAPGNVRWADNPTQQKNKRQRPRKPGYVKQDPAISKANRSEGQRRAWARREAEALARYAATVEEIEVDWE